MTAVATRVELPRTPRPGQPGRRARAVVLLVAVVVVAMIALGGAASGRHEDVGAVTAVSVGEGETAWEVLRPHTPQGTPHEVFVHEVLQANGVDARELRPGDVLVVPGGEPR